MIALVCSSLLVLTVSNAVDEPASTPAALSEFNFTFDPAAGSTLSLGLLQDVPPERSSSQPFGLADSAYWMINAGGGGDLDREHFAKFGGAISYFLFDDISIDLELNYIHFWQGSDNTPGVNFNLLLRWHFYHNEARTWSVYVDGGAGMLGTADDVPETGSSFNFTPQFGAGISFDVGNDMRLFTGARWFHVSNARLYENNPGADYGMLYAMLSWPF